MGNYFVSKCPAARSLLAWAEKFEGEEISEATLHEIATMPGTVMSPPLMDSLNGQIWGFLSNCVAAEADTVFKGALDLQGLTLGDVSYDTSATATASSLNRCART